LDKDSANEKHIKQLKIADFKIYLLLIGICAYPTKQFALNRSLVDRKDQPKRYNFE
jgi:hypothetical protein